MAEPTELDRVLAALDVGAACDRTNHADATMADAARLLRSMASDFAKHSCHASGCGIDPESPECNCGIFAARAKWRLP